MTEHVPPTPSLSLQPMPPYPWQQALWQRFVQLVQQDRLAHAQLVGGPQGLGGKALADAMGRYLLCKAPVGPFACGKCRDCKLLGSETHPDLFVVEPEGTSSVIKVDQIRQLTDFIGKTAQQGGRKVVLLSPAEAMNINAANALLKSLEEPTARTYLLLVSFEPSQLIATIRSRCAKLLLTVPSAAVALDWLRTMGVPDAEALLEEAGSQPLKVQRWYEQDFPSQRAKLAQDLVQLTEGRRSPLAVAKTWLDYEPVALVDTLLVWVQTAVRQQNGLAAVSTTELGQYLCQVPHQTLFLYWERLGQAKKDLLSQNNPNVELLLDELFMGWAALAAHGRSVNA